MRKKNVYDSFYECALVKASKHEFISKPILRTKGIYPKYKAFHNNFQVDGQSTNSRSSHRRCSLKNMFLILQLY